MFTVNSPSSLGSSVFSSKATLTTGGACKVAFAPETVDVSLHCMYKCV